jgi:MFS family permease
MFMEVPTGAISDMVGKRKTLILAMLLNGMGYIIMGAGDTLAVLVIGFWITQVGWAFFSGADEAMAYDSLKEVGEEMRFDRIISRANTLSIITLVVSTLIGGVMYNLNFRLPHYAWGIILLTGVVAAFYIREPKIKREPFTIRGYSNQLLRGFHQLTQPQLRPFLLLIFGILGVAYLFGYGLVQPAIATEFGFLADEQAVVYAIIAAATAIAMHFIPRLRRYFNEMQMLIMLTIMMSVGFLGAALPLGTWGFFALLFIRMSGGIAQPWVSIIVNHKIPSEDRATTLSTVALLTKIPYVVTAIIAGQMVQDGTLWFFNAVIAILLLITVIISLIFTLRRSPQPESTVASSQTFM